MKPAFELFDHTADIGIRARAASLPDLLLAAKDGLYGLLRDFLHELLILFERDGRVVTSLDVEAFDESHLRATGQADQVDPERSQFAREVKAITYHELDVRRIHAGFEATVIVDI
jgi:SHS2 domain-containing protein